jgi:hypothetical protein
MGTYIYGIVRATVCLNPDAVGAAAYLVPHEDIAAIASDADGATMASADALRGHQRLLDAVAAQHAVLPLRFGTMLGSPESVEKALLAPAHEQFRAALATLEGCAQYLVQGRYVQETVLGEVLAESPEARALRDDVVSVANEGATRALRIRLGEIVVSALAARREADTRSLGAALAPCCVACSVRDPAHTDDAVNLALLVKTARQAELEQLTGQVASGWDGRVKLRVLGPMAPYDFAHGIAAGG